jgi:hypothetical protein
MTPHREHLFTLTAFLSLSCYTGCSGGVDTVSDAISVAKFWKVRSTLKRTQYMKDRRLVKLLLYINRSSKEDSQHIPNQLADPSCIRLYSLRGACIVSISVSNKLRPSLKDHRKGSNHIPSRRPPANRMCPH